MLSRLDIARIIDAADVARERRDWASAAATYRRALERDPTLGHIWVQYGHALKEQGAFAEAEQAYRRALPLDDGAADTHLQLGHALKLQGRTAEAAEAYCAAAARDIDLLDAWAELVGLGRSPDDVWERLGGPDGASDGSIVCDASDLFYHYANVGPIASGIQRVQIKIIDALLDDAERRVDVGIACYVADRCEWVAIPERIYAALVGRAVSRLGWDGQLRRLRLHLAHARRLHFPQRVALLNLGTSWWLPNYFLALRNLADRDVRLYHFIHDVVPALHPEWCAPGLPAEFLPGLVNVQRHAAGVLLNSQATGRDLDSVIAALGLPQPPQQAIRLDGWPLQSAMPAGSGLPPRIPEDFGIAGDFVLFVATLEPRKNHALAFAAWSRLIAERGAAAAPLLVCVGRRGWRFDDGDRLLATDPTLAAHVRLLDDVSDDELAVLYRDCLFTVYPSRYEGWGLPVSEALAYGRVVLVADVSALPEAGGDLAEYFDPAEAGDFDRKLRRLIDDPAYRRQRQSAIARDYRPRAWAQIAAQVVDCLAVWRTAAGNPAALAPRLWAGAYLPMARSRAADRQDLLEGAAIYRRGAGWDAPDDAGCIARGDAATIAFALPEAAERPHLLYLHVENPDGDPVALAASGGGAAASATLMPQVRRCLRLSLDRSQISRGETRLTLTLTRADGDASRETPPAIRVLGLYVCAADDERGRLAFLDALALGDPLVCARRTGDRPVG